MSLKTCEKAETNVYALEISLEGEEFKKAVSNAYNKNKGRYNVPGFRKGKVPRAMIEKMYGVGVFYEEAANTLMQNSYPAAVEESGVDLLWLRSFLVRCN